jgi:lipopolysaccharide transport system ATP-binding protein
METLLELRSVSYSYRASRANFARGEHKVLDNVSFAVRRGEKLGIVGRNGAGKSTLLRLMAGILAPHHGDVLRHPRARCALLSIGLGFQEQLSGRDNALLASMLQGMPKREARARLPEIQKFSELGVSFDEPVKTYSAGMRARLGFTTALLTEVEILLIDEVLGVGDAGFRGKATEALQRKISGEVTVVLVSHAEPQLRNLCTRGLWLSDGRLMASGNVQEVLIAYRDGSQQA